MHPPYDLVIFDFDGTLADSFPFFVEVINELAALHGFRPVAAHEVPELRHCAPRDIMRRMDFPARKLPLVARSFRGLMHRSIERVPLVEGVQEMVQALASSGMQLAIVSSNAVANVRAVLGAGLLPAFAHIDGGASILGKAPRLRRVAVRCGAAPARTLYVGDVAADAQAAAEAGLAFGAVCWGYGSLQSFRGYELAHVFTHPGEIVPAALHGCSGGRRAPGWSPPLPEA